MKCYIFLFLISLLALTNAHATPMMPYRPIIHISKAQHLSAEGKLISDITKQVKAKDNIWAAIHNGEYVRVTYERVLDRNYDNAVYARPSDPNKPATIEVYPVYTDKKGERIEMARIAAFPIINHEGFYKILLTKLLAPTDTFDFKIIGNSVDIDYIVDPTFTLLYSMGSINYGKTPSGSLILSGSTLYGMTSNGGVSGDGIIFSVGTDGSSFTILHNFSGGSTDGENPNGSLILSGSTLYGMAPGGGASNKGIIFSISTSGGTLTDLHDFSGSSTDGSGPNDSLTLSGSTLYGVTVQGGVSNDGIIFSISTSGGTLTDLHDFSGSSTDGAAPVGSLILSGSTLYGMTQQGGASDEGIIFSISTSGGTLTDLHDFSGSSTDGAYPNRSLTLSGSTLYGMTEEGGAFGIGIIFSIATSGGTLTDLHDFSESSTDGAYPQGSLTLSGSTLYGMAYLGGALSNGIIFSISTSGGTLTDLHDFSGSSTDGENPIDSLTLSGSTLYGMALGGGAFGIGLIFSISTSGGTLTDLHDFSGSSIDGASPIGSLTLSGSTLYGMTGGGTSNKGIIFSIGADGSSFTILHNFTGTSTDGKLPYGSLTLSGSTLYGMTLEGGAFGIGIIFSIATSGGTLTDLHDFSGSSTDGAGPQGSLTLSGSTLYGMTPNGGASGEGIIFSIATSGGTLTDMHDFSGSSIDGASPIGSLTLSGSTLYGMTPDGGASGEGIIFSISTSGGTLTDLHDFSGGSTDGGFPRGSLTLSGSTLYGMAYQGGAFGIGIIFSIATSGGTLTDLHDFSFGPTDGILPYGSLTLSGSTLYGMTLEGGASGEGIIFSIATSGGTLTDLHDFTGSSTDGSNPEGSLTE